MDFVSGCLGALVAAAISCLVMAGIAVSESSRIRDCDEFGKTRLNGVIYACAKLPPVLSR